MSITIAVDVAKSIFEVAVSDRPGRVVKRSRLSRSQFSRLLVTHPPATVLMEACGTAHFWGRYAVAHGHDVALLPPHAVRPYVPRNETDRADTTALLEAARNDAIHPVPVKSASQQTLTALHRLRAAWIAARTARLNTVRGVLREFGLVIPVGARNVLPRVTALLAG
jgi:transposase